MTSFVDLKVSRKSGTIAEISRFSCEPGQLSIILGHSGSGKTSLLMAMAGLGDDNNLFVSGKVQHSDGRFSELTGSREPFCTLVFQNASLYEDLTVQENLEIIRSSKFYVNNIDVSLLDKLLHDIIPHLTPAQLSGGQRQRVAIARNLLCGSKVILMDEPNAGLDPQSADDLLALIEQLCELGMHVLLTTHHPTKFIGKANQFYFLYDGDLKKIDESEISDVYQNSKKREVSQTGKLANGQIELLGNGHSSWIWKFFSNDIWVHCFSPSALLYIGVAAILISFTFGFTMVSKYPFSGFVLDLTIERIAAELGDTFYRFIVPLTVCVLFAARSSAISTMDALQKGLNFSEVSLEQVGVSIRSYRLYSLLSSLAIGNVVLFAFGLVVSLYALILAISFAADLPFLLVTDFTVQDILSSSVWISRVAFVWLKVALSGACVALVIYFVGHRPVRSALEIKQLGAHAISFSVVVVILIHTAFILVEVL